MPETADCFARTQASLGAWLRSLDWALIVLVAGFVLVAPIPGLHGWQIASPLEWVARYLMPDPIAQYRQALAAAALKRPDYRRTLAVIAQDKVDVITFRPPGDLPLKDRTREMWVALSTEAQKACAGAQDPVRRLQQLLGLPPVAAAKNVVTEIEVPSKGIFRPCVGQGDITTPTCDFELAMPPPQGADLPRIMDAYEALHFETQQMWSSYRLGFRDNRRAPSDYPDSGFPFTGMGWSYDWSNQSHDHFGVSEFVIKPDVAIKILSEKTPAEFCGGK
jgi:hypothetical protein